MPGFESCLCHLTGMVYCFHKLWMQKCLQQCLAYSEHPMCRAFAYYYYCYRHCCAHTHGHGSEVRDDLTDLQLKQWLSLGVWRKEGCSYSPLFVCFEFFAIMHYFLKQKKNAANNAFTHKRILVKNPTKTKYKTKPRDICIYFDSWETQKVVFYMQLTD